MSARTSHSVLTTSTWTNLDMLFQCSTPSGIVRTARIVIQTDLTVATGMATTPLALGEDTEDALEEAMVASVEAVEATVALAEAAVVASEATVASAEAAMATVASEEAAEDHGVATEAAMAATGATEEEVVADTTTTMEDKETVTHTQEAPTDPLFYSLILFITAVECFNN